MVERGHDEAVDAVLLGEGGNKDVGEGICRNPAGTNDGGVDDMVKHSGK